MASRGMKSRFKVNEWDREFQTKSIRESRRVIKETNVKKKKGNQEVNESEDSKIIKPNEIMKNPNRKKKKKYTMKVKGRDLYP